MDMSYGRVGDVFNLTEAKKIIAFLEEEKTKYINQSSCRKTTIAYLDLGLSICIAITTLWTSVSAGLVSVIPEDYTQISTIITAVVSAVVLAQKGILLKLDRDLKPIKSKEELAREACFEVCLCMSRSIQDDVITPDELEKLQDIERNYHKATCSTTPLHYNGRLRS